ncbi:hypothetical protein [Denitratisoma sp. agr-D3]
MPLDMPDEITSADQAAAANAMATLPMRLLYAPIFLPLLFIVVNCNARYLRRDDAPR